MKIYLVDDDHDDHTFFKEAVSSLELQDCRVISLFDGKELMEELKKPEDKPQAVVLDLNMPLMNGFKTLEILKSKDEFKLIPVFILTTSNKQNDIQKCFSLGCESFFTKPTQLSKLKTILSEILHKVNYNKILVLPAAFVLVY